MKKHTLPEASKWEFDTIAFTKKYAKWLEHHQTCVHENAWKLSENDRACLIAFGTGSGNNHSLLMRVAHAYKKMGIPMAAAIESIRPIYASHYPYTCERDISRALDAAYHGKPYPLTPKKKTNKNKTKRIDQKTIRKNVELAISANSKLPKSRTLKSLTIKDVFKIHYKPKSLVCIGTSLKTAKTLKLEELLKLDNSRLESFQFSVANSMRKPHGISKTGNQSQRCDDNACELEEVLTYECDLEGIDKKIQKRVIAFITKQLPLISVCDSANKSLHARFSVRGLDAAQISEAKQFLIALGADSMSLQKHQFVRTPNAMRNCDKVHSKRQTLLWISPELTQAEASPLSIKLDSQGRIISNTDTEECGELCFYEHLQNAILSGSELLKKKIPVRETILHPFFKQGDLGFIFGTRGLGKTWISTGIAKAISEASSFGDWSSDQSRRVLIVDGEMNLDDSQKRLRLINAQGSLINYIHHEELFLSSEGQASLNLADLSQQAAVTQLIGNLGSEVVILDNLSCLFRGVSENEADAWEAVLPWLLDLRRRGVSVIIVAHAGRNGQMRGTSRREDAAHWILSLERSQDDDGEFNGARFRTRFTKNRNATDEQCPSLMWELLSDGNTVTVSSTTMSDIDAMLELIRNGIDSATDLAQELGKNKGTISKWAKKLQDQGRIKIIKGKYKTT